MSLKVEKVLARKRSKFQDILLFDSATYGKVLVLDGVVQVTERDEASYQECIAHIPLMAHPAPRRVLIIGGGDGGVLREVCRHSGVAEVVMCEIDEEVVGVAKEHLAGSTASAYGDERLALHFADAAEYVAGRPGAFDVIIMDSSDPVGPAESLYAQSFLGTMAAALAPGGVLCMQGECQWLHLEFIADTLKAAQGLFAEVDYAYTGVPTYPCGQIGFILARGPLAGASAPATLGTSLRSPARPLPPALAAQLRYYTPALHAAAFQLPAFAEKALAAVRAPSVAGAPATPTWQLAVGASLLAAAALAAGVALGTWRERRANA